MRKSQHETISGSQSLLWDSCTPVFQLSTTRMHQYQCLSSTKVKYSFLCIKEAMGYLKQDTNYWKHNKKKKGYAKTYLTLDQNSQSVGLLYAFIVFWAVLIMLPLVGHTDNRNICPVRLLVQNKSDAQLWRFKDYVQLLNLLVDVMELLWNSISECQCRNVKSTVTNKASSNYPPEVVQWIMVNLK